MNSPPSPSNSPPQCKPVYLALPTDLIHAKVSSEDLKTPLVSGHIRLSHWDLHSFSSTDLHSPPPSPPPSPHPRRCHAQPHPHSAPPHTDVHLTNKDQAASLAYAVKSITHMFEEAKNPIVIVDCCTERYGMAPEIRKLVEATGVRFFESEFWQQDLIRRCKGSQVFLTHIYPAKLLLFVSNSPDGKVGSKGSLRDDLSPTN